MKIWSTKVKLNAGVVRRIKSRKKTIEKLRIAMREFITHPIGAPERSKKISKLNSVTSLCNKHFGVLRAKKIAVIITRQEMKK